MGAFVPVPQSGGSLSVTTKGDIQTYSTVPARLPVGTDGQILQAQSGQTTGLLWTNGGKLVQRVNAVFTSDNSTTSTIPFDDTIPQNNEGAQLGTLSITPKSTSNYLLVRVNAPFVSGVSTAALVMAIFKDSDANAKQLGAALLTNTNYIGNIVFEYIEQCSGTSSQTWAIRYGPDSGTMYLGRTNASGKFGTLPGVTLIIDEYSL